VVAVDFTRREQIIIIVIIIIMISGTGVLFWTKQKPVVAQPTVPPVEKMKEPVVPKNVVVHIAGAVMQAGVFTLPAGSRVMDALKIAGGPSQGADLNAINLAALLVDGQQIRIPSLDEPGYINQSVTVRGSKTADAKVSINMADLNALDTLPGIGPSMAQKIIDYRRANGPFQSLEDLKKVPGIGESKYQNLKEKITL
jgi:competence protein ComEA